MSCGCKLRSHPQVRSIEPHAAHLFLSAAHLQQQAGCGSQGPRGGVNHALRAEAERGGPHHVPHRDRRQVSPGPQVRAPQCPHALLAITGSTANGIAGSTANAIAGILHKAGALRVRQAGGVLSTQ